MKKTRHSNQASNGSKQLSFLPEPDFNPKWPTKNTFSYLALELLLQGKEITALYFENESSSQRLPAYINILCNKLGWPVQREDVTITLRKKPKRRKFRQYYFKKEFISNLKKITGGAIW